MEKPIKGIAGYSVTEDGKVISYKGKFPRVLKTSVNNCGYEIVTISINNRRKTFYVHRLVAQTFIGDIDGDMTVNHKDGNKLNNHVSNLEIVSYSENEKHAYEYGLKPHMTGETNGMSKLSEQQAMSLIYDIIQGLSNKEIGRKYGLHPQYVSLIRHKRRWIHLWRLVERATTIPEREYTVSD